MCSPANGLAQKLYNWSTLNQKVIAGCTSIEHTPCRLIGVGSGAAAWRRPASRTSLVWCSTPGFDCKGVSAPGLCAAAPGVRGGRGVRSRRHRARAEAAAHPAGRVRGATPAGRCQVGTVVCMQKISLHELLGVTRKVARNIERTTKPLREAGRPCTSTTLFPLWAAALCCNLLSPRDLQMQR